MVKAIPILFVLGVKEARDDTKATMPKADKMSQYLVPPKTLINPPAQICPRAVAAETVHFDCGQLDVPPPTTKGRLTESQPA